MEQGIIPWQKPWVAAGKAVSYATGKPYSLLNQMLLGQSGEYATFKQVQQADGCVRKGEKAHMVVFWKFLKVQDEETLLAGAFKVSWKPYTASRFDSARFKKDHAELAAAYTKTTTARRFSIN